MYHHLGLRHALLVKRYLIRSRIVKAVERNLPDISSLWILELKRKVDTKRNRSCKLRKVLKDARLNQQY